MDENENLEETVQEPVVENVESVEETVQESTAAENVETNETTNTTTKNKGKSGLIILIAMIAIIALLLIFERNNNNSIKKLAGSYELVEMYDKGEDATESLKFLEDYGMTFSLNLNEDGTGEIDIMGEKKDLTFTESSIIIDGETQEFSVDDEKRIVIEGEDETKMIFAKKTSDNSNNSDNKEEKKSAISDLIGEEDEDSIVGKYKIVELSDNEGDMSSQLSQMEELGMTITMELKEDGTGEISVLGETMEFTYDDKYFISEGDKSEYTVDEEGKITMIDTEENGGTKMVFEKITEEAEDTIETEDAVENNN